MAENRRAPLLLTFFILFCTDSALVNTNNERIWARIAWIIILVLGCKYIPKGISRITHKMALFLGAMSIGILASMVYHEGIGINYIQRIVLIWLAFSLTVIYDKEQAISSFVSAMRFIAIFSLICFALTPLILQVPFPIMSCGENDTFKALLFTNVSTSMTRNFGPFWEPGAFQIYLNLALLLVISKDRFKISDVIIFSLCVISTLSTSGIIILGLIFLYYVGSPSNRNTSVAVFSRFFIILIAIAGTYIFYKSGELSDAFFFKLSALADNADEINSSNISSYTRLYSIFSSLSAIREFPIFGAGIEGFREYCLNKFFITSNTNTLLATPATYGIFTGFLYLYLFFKSTFNKGLGLIGISLIYIIFIIIFSTENLMVSLPMWILLFYGFDDRNKRLI